MTYTVLLDLDQQRIEQQDARAHSFIRYQTFLPANLKKVERVGFTRNASQTPYIVYITTAGRRCCTFVKRRLFYDLLRLLLGIKEKVDAKILSVRVTEWNGLILKSEIMEEYAIASGVVNSFFLHYHRAAFDQVTATLNEIGAIVTDVNGKEHKINLVRCDCTILYDVCPHRIATKIQLLNGGWTNVAEYIHFAEYNRRLKADLPSLATGRHRKKPHQ